MIEGKAGNSNSLVQGVESVEGTGPTARGESVWPDEGAPPGPAVRVVRATAPDQAESAVRDVYLPNRLEPLEAGELSMSLAAVALGTTTVGRLHYGRRMRVVTEEARQLHVN